VIIRGVEKTGLAERYSNPYHPHDIALMFTIESWSAWRKRMIAAYYSLPMRQKRLRTLH